MDFPGDLRFSPETLKARAGYNRGCRTLPLDCERVGCASAGPFPSEGEGTVTEPGTKPSPQVTLYGTCSGRR